MKTSDFSNNKQLLALSLFGFTVLCSTCLARGWTICCSTLLVGSEACSLQQTVHSSKTVIPPPEIAASTSLKPELQPEKVVHHPKGDFCADVETLPYPAGERIRLHSLKSKKTIWEHQGKAEERIVELKWSPDGKALIYVEGNSGGAWHFVTWYIGKGETSEEDSMYVFDSPALRGATQDDCHNFAWSPDNNRVLFRTFYSGFMDADSSDLYCFHADNGYVHQVSHGVRRAEWASPTRIKYWRVDSRLPQIQDPRDTTRDYRIPAVRKTPDFWQCKIPLTFPTQSRYIEEFH